jgi:hypothetical protein
MRDVLGIAVAVLIALLSQIVEPWSAPWWGGMIASAVIAGSVIIHLVWRALAESRKALWIRIVVALVLAAGALGFDLWYFSNFSRSGWITWLSSPPVPQEPPKQPPKQEPPTQEPKPWVTDEEIKGQAKLSRELLPHSPDDLLQTRYMRGPESVSSYPGSWIKISGQFFSVEERTVEKRTFELVQIYRLKWGEVMFYFDIKWKAKLNQLKDKNNITAMCQLIGVNPGLLYAGGCELIDKL